jgi:hypothetical protein
MKNYLLIVCSLLLFSGLITAQEVKKENAPDEQIIVNKKYDEKGNLIQYDSTYIHQWSSDSTLRFSFPNNDFFAGNDFPDLNEFFRNFMDNPVIGEFPFSDNFNFSDSMFINRFLFPNDSSVFLPFQQPDFGFQGLEEIQQLLNKHFENSPFLNFQTPQFLNEKQREDWENLIKKHQLEMEELKKQWEQLIDE